MLDLTGEKFLKILAKNIEKEQKKNYKTGDI